MALANRSNKVDQAIPGQDVLKRILRALATALGEDGLLTGEAVASRAESWSSSINCRALGIALPRSTEEVATVLRLCHDEAQPVVPYGGGTGLVGGAIASPHEIVISLERMRAIEEVDTVMRTATVQAGATLESVQQAAAKADLYFPLDLGARGTATIGGNLATNAGGNRVIRYGMMRDMVLGLEAVLADGTVLTSMNRLIKNNAGYDLKQLFIGTEGTLGVVTRAVLRLREHWNSQMVALVATDEFGKLPLMLKSLDRRLGGTLSAFEVMWPEFYELVTTPPAGNQPPLPRGHSYYCLVEALGGDEEIDRQRFEGALAALLNDGTILDAAIASSRQQAAQLWALRDDVEQILRIGPLFMFDVGLPIPAMEAYVAQVRSALACMHEHAVCVAWGHMGDSNLHLWITVHDASDKARVRVERIVYDPLVAIGGTVSAEHGIGAEKLDYLDGSRSPAEISLMRQLKRLLDPKGILNPGKVVG